MRFRGPGNHMTGQGILNGRVAAWRPILGTDTYPSCWQGWRLPIASSSRPQAFELAIATNLGPGVHMAWKAHYIPRY